MSDITNNLDADARAEFLCYLVVLQLASRSLTNKWLTVDNLIESTRIWLDANGGRADLATRIMLVRAAQELAPTLPLPHFPTTKQEMAKLFSNRRQLDYRVPVVKTTFDLCEHTMARGP
jgi:hypothetical protein